MRISLHELLDPKILIVLSLLGILMISLLYPASVHQFSCEYREDLPLGSFVWIEGKVEELRVIEGNIILRISGYPQVFIPEGSCLRGFYQESQMCQFFPNNSLLLASRRLFFLPLNSAAVRILFLKSPR